VHSLTRQKYGYDVQAFIYTRLFGVPIDKFFFIAIDKASLDIGIYGISPEFVEEGERKTMEAIELYKQFFILGEDLDFVHDCWNPLTQKRNENSARL
jgi:hypothetical protein